jgi:hypothetical protein
MTVRQARQSHAAGWRGLQRVADIEAAHAGPLLALRSALSSISGWTTCARRSGTRDTKTTGNGQAQGADAGRAVLLVLRWRAG